VSMTVAVALLAAVWLMASLGGGAVLALLAQRIHPSLSFPRLWVFYSAILAFTVAAVLAIAWW
jgi:hypothetical protein